MSRFGGWSGFAEADSVTPAWPTLAVILEGGAAVLSATGSEQVDVLYHLGVSSDDPAVEGFSDTKFVVMSGTQERAKCVVWGHAGEHSLRCHRDLAVVDADHH